MQPPRPANLVGTSAGFGGASGLLSTPANLVGTSAASGSASGHLIVPAPVLVASGMIHDPFTDPIGGTPTIAQPERRTATAEDYAYFLVPLTVAYGAYGVIVRYTTDAAAGVYSVAIFLIVSVAMRDQDVSKLVARFADFFRPPDD